MLINSLGLIELRSISRGIKTTDEMLKSADVEIIMSSSICPGKYVILVSGKKMLKMSIKKLQDLKNIFS